MGNLLQAFIQKVRHSRFSNHNFMYTALYLMMLAPPRAFKIKQNENVRGGELARFPTYCVVLIELIVRVAFLLMLAACVETALGNTLYEMHKIDTFFVALVLAGTVHSTTFYLIFNADNDNLKASSLFLFYRLVRNSCYAVLAGFISVVPVFIWNWDQEMPPFSDGVALQFYLWTAALFFVVGVVEAKYMNRLPLGGRNPNRATRVPQGNIESTY